MYTPSETDIKKIENNFVYHAPKEGQNDRYITLRQKAREFAMYLAQNCPPSRELSVALTELETCMMWANAAIARNE